MPEYRYDHIHLRSPDPNTTAHFFETMFGAEVKRDIYPPGTLYPGQVRVRTTDRVNYEGQLMLEITVSDTGSGMPPEVLENVFSQRLTLTKGSERGYGLSNAFTLVKQLGGHVLCRSEPERGTTFTVLLPRALQAPAH